MKKIIRVIVIVLFIITVSVFLVIMINKDTNEKVEDKKDEKIYVENGAIYEKTGEVNIGAIENNIGKINRLCEEHLGNMNIYFSIIPDKEYYLKDVLETEFDNLENAVKSKITGNVKYFSIEDTLS